jgi:hypothetical protein
MGSFVHALETLVVLTVKINGCISCVLRHASVCSSIIPFSFCGLCDQQSTRVLFMVNCNARNVVTLSLLLILPSFNNLEANL